MMGFGMWGNNETVVCALHGKKRSRDAMIDDGVGNFSCQPGKECKVTGNTKHVPCTFWQAGKCTKGESCNFSHDPNAVAAAENGYGGWGGCNGYQDGGKGKGWDAGKGWDSWGGYGAYGKAGMLAKGMQMMASKGMGKGYGKSKGPGKDGGFGIGVGVKGGGTFLCAVHGKLRSASAVVEVGAGQYQCRPDSECKGAGGASKVKTAMCKFFLEGRCTKGSTCSFAHGMDEIGMPVLDGTGIGAPPEEPQLNNTPEMIAQQQLAAQANQARFSPY
ncbi:unnamed protein product [Symbiodinium pilosum]|uniref:C3H1-type domain-containing protein n=1 Tax=Symbiodinium pilosum TaxID=2952 RepID=A0A812KQS0_SYMPI|nr:unnamed protein product [Symbiodinium pilosum]